MAKVTHVAVVDDEAEIRDAIDEYLTMHGFKVSQADGGTALRRLFGKNLLEGAAIFQRAQQLRGFGLPVKAGAFEYRPRLLA